jgi:hypothetical protein
MEPLRSRQGSRVDGKSSPGDQAVEHGEEAARWPEQIALHPTGQVYLARLLSSHLPGENHSKGPHRRISVREPQGEGNKSKIVLPVWHSLLLNSDWVV